MIFLVDYLYHYGCSLWTAIVSIHNDRESQPGDHRMEWTGSWLDGRKETMCLLSLEVMRLSGWCGTGSWDLKLMNTNSDPVGSLCFSWAEVRQLPSYSTVEMSPAGKTSCKWRRWQEPRCCWRALQATLGQLGTAWLVTAVEPCGQWWSSRGSHADVTDLCHKVMCEVISSKYSFCFSSKA